MSVVTRACISEMNSDRMQIQYSFSKLFTVELPDSQMWLEEVHPCISWSGPQTSLKQKMEQELDSKKPDLMEITQWCYS